MKEEKIFVRGSPPMGYGIVPEMSFVTQSGNWTLPHHGIAIKIHRSQSILDS